MAKNSTNTLLIAGAAIVAVYFITKKPAPPPLYPAGYIPPGYPSSANNQASPYIALGTGVANALANLFESHTS